jgi:hypothetical protein
MTLRQTHTYALLGVSQRTYSEVAALLHNAGYDHCFGPDGEIDMHGIALVADATDPVASGPQRHSTVGSD